MARLPVPGADGSNWGEILNDFLLTSHNVDGTLRADSVAPSIVAASDSPEQFKKVAQFICDGDNDQDMINVAIAMLGDSGGRVQLSPGTFRCNDAIRLPRRTSLIGRGRSTILRAEGSWQAYDGSGPGGVIEAADEGTDKTYVADLVIDGNRYQGSDVHGIYYNITTRNDFDEGPDSAHVFSNIYIYETRRHGVFFKGTNMRASFLNSIRVYNVGDEGETVAHGFCLQTNDSFYSQCESGTASGSGFFIEGSNNRFTNCKAWFSDLSGWQVLNQRNQFAACEAQDNKEHGYYITTGPNSFSACHADSNSWDRDNNRSNFDGFHIPWGSRIQLMGCSAYDKDEGGRGHWQRYGFYIGRDAQHCQIMGTVKNNVSGAISGEGLNSGLNWVQVNG